MISETRTPISAIRSSVERDQLLPRVFEAGLTVLCLCCGITLWQYYIFGLRAIAYHFVIGFLLVCFAIDRVASPARRQWLSPEFRPPAGFLAAIGILSALTFLSLGRAPDQ